MSHYINHHEFRLGSPPTKHLELQLLRLFPRVFLVGEVTVRGGLEVDGTGQVQFLDDDTGSQVKVVLDDFDQFFRRTVRGAVGVDVDRQRFGDTNGVRELHQGSSGEASVDQRLGNPSGGVSSRSVDLGEVLTREGTTTVGTPTTVGVDDDLSTGQTGVTLGTTDDESARGLDVVDGLVVQQFRGDNLLDDVLLDFLSEVFSGDLVGVLGRDDDGVDSEGLDGTAVLLVFDGDLGLGVGSQPGQGAVSSGVGQGGVELVRQKHRQRQLFVGFVGGVTEHDTLVTGTQFFQGLFQMQTLGDVGRLLFDGDQHVTGLVVEPLFGVVVTNVLDGVTDDLLVVQLGLGGDFTEHHDHTGLGGGFTRDLRQRVDGETRVQDGVGHLVTDLVGVAFTDRFRGEQELFRLLGSHGCGRERGV